MSMSRYILGIVFCLLGSWAFTQNQLVNYFNSFSQVYGGMEDGGIQRTESYHFIVNANIAVLSINENGAPLQLKKKDTLIVHIHSFKPYHDNTPKLDSSLIEKQILENNKDQANSFQIYRMTRKIYANISLQTPWDRRVEFQLASRRKANKAKTYAIVAKAVFDSGNTSYAP